MDQHLNFQHSFRDVIQEITSLHLNYYISWCYTVREANIIGKSASIYTLKSLNKQLMYTFLYFVVTLQSRFYTLGLIFVFDVTIYSYTLRLFKIDPVVSVLPATNRQYFILALSLPLRWLRVTFVLNTLIALKELFFRPSDIAKRLRINVLVIL